MSFRFLVTKLWKNKIPDPNEFFKPLYGTYGGNFKVKTRTHATHPVFCVISKAAQQVLPKGGTFGTSGPSCGGISPLTSCLGAFTVRVTHGAGASRGFFFVFHLFNMLWADSCP